MASSRVPAITPEQAFLHVIYDYRYLALALYAWNTYGHKGNEGAQREVNHLIPGVGVLLQDSLLLHIRSLCDLYTKTMSNDDSDILLVDFGFRTLAQSRKDRLDIYKKSIELHALHLTAYRDTNHRRATPMTTGHGRARPSRRVVFNNQNSKMADDLIEALRITASQRNPWQMPFQALHAATMNETTSPGNWPKELGNWSDVKKYLRKLGFTV